MPSEESGTPKVRADDRLTIADAQIFQPWTVPYAGGVLRAEAELVPHILGSHCALHAAKSVGKLASVFESLDHDPVINPAQLATIEDMAADLITAALRMGNLYGFDLEDVLVRRVLEKNGVNIFDAIKKARGT